MWPAFEASTVCPCACIRLSLSTSFILNARQARVALVGPEPMRLKAATGAPQVPQYGTGGVRRARKLLSEAETCVLKPALFDCSGMRLQRARELYIPSSTQNLEDARSSVEPARKTQPHTATVPSADELTQVALPTKLHCSQTSSQERIEGQGSSSRSICTAASSSSCSCGPAALETGVA